MAKISLSDLQMNRVNELAYDIWRLILEANPGRKEMPEFLRNVTSKAEYALKDAIALALRAVYIPDSRYAGHLAELLFFLDAGYEYCRHLVKNGSADRHVGKLFLEYGAALCRINEMAVEKLVHAPKK